MKDLTNQSNRGVIRTLSDMKECQDSDYASGEALQWTALMLIPFPGDIAPTEFSVGLKTENYQNGIGSLTIPWTTYLFWNK